MAKHIPVLLPEVLSQSDIHAGEIIVDATLGGGGYSLEILKKLGEEGRLIAFDRDPKAIKVFRRRLGSVENKHRVTLVLRNYSEIAEVWKENNWDRADTIIADLGISSDQLEDTDLGLSFERNESLDMRLDRDSEQMSAREMVNTFSPDRLIKILKEYGDEAYAGKIVNEIVKRREEKEIETTGELREIIETALPGKERPRIIQHLAKVFMALRMEANQELKHLRTFLERAIEVLKPGGKLIIVTFHSGEDAIVKHFFREKEQSCTCPPELPKCVCETKQELRIVTKKPIIPGKAECEINPRARSAKLRVAEKT